MRLLDQLSLPGDLVSLSRDKMDQIAGEIREEIIQTVSETGGHLGPSLGVVELTLALHAELVTPRDKIIWDVGHQSYAHKIVTGRLPKFRTIRTYGGLSGFPNRSESEHDACGTGHSSTSVSIGVGLAEAFRLAGEDGEGAVVSVIGDGALTGGMAYEGLNQAGHLGSRLVVVLNDNNMSIRKNVGAMSAYLSRLRSDPTLSRIRHDLEKRVQKFPGIGEGLYTVGEQLKDGVKAALAPGMLFEELGFTYLGVLDGHNVSSLRANLRRALSIDGPVLLHVKTVKGKGYSPAEERPDSFHGTTAFSIQTGEKIDGGATAVSYTKAFGQALVHLAKEDERVVGITAAMASGTGLNLLEDALPDQFFDVGIAEGHAVGFAAGLAIAGYRPVVAVYSTFLQRAYDQVIHDVCLQGLPVILALDRAGLVGEDGPTHHGAFDLSFLRLIPGLTVLVPKDEAELQTLLASAMELNAPVAIRFPRGPGLGVDLPDFPRPLRGPWMEVLKEGEDVLLLATGTGVQLATEAAGRLAEMGIKAGVVNARRVNPLAESGLEELLERYSHVVTIEENVLAGGFGSAVLEFAQETRLTCHVGRVGLPNRFITHGDMASLKAEIGYTVEGVVGEAARVMGVDVTRV